MISVIIACGGNSTRMGGINKLLLDLEGMTVCERTVRAFCDIPDVREIILTCSLEFKNAFLEKLTGEIPVKLKFAQNGETRQKSVENGILSCDENSQLVCVHDGARPLILKDTIIKAISDAKEYGASVVCVPCKDTVKVADSKGNVCNTPPRETLFLTQTPQIFILKKYKEALNFAKEKGLDFTDDSQLFEAVGEMPHITVGDYTNIKITTPDDIIIAKQILAVRKEK